MKSQANKLRMEKLRIKSQINLDENLNPTIPVNRIQLTPLTNY